MGKSNIEWTDETWNPVAGCSKVSAGCKHCYAERMAARCNAMGQEKYTGTVDHKGHWTGRVNFDPVALLAPLRWKKPRMVFVNSMSDLFHEEVSFGQIAAVFGVMAACDRHTFQVLTKRPARALEFFAWVEKRAADGRELFPHDTAEWRIWQLLHATAGVYGSPPSHHGGPWPLANVWLGVSVENQEQADARIPKLLECPAVVRFLSCEPLLGPVDIGMSSATCDCCPRWESRWVKLHRAVRSDLPMLAGLKVARAGIHRASSNRHGALAVEVPGGKLGIKPDEFECLPKIDWVICGGESGPGARPMHPDWARGLRDQCVAAGMPFFFKQWGEWAPGECGDGPPTKTERTATHFNDEWIFGEITVKASEELHCDDAPDLYRLGKARAGRMLDSVIHNEFPKVGV